MSVVASIVLQNGMDEEDHHNGKMKGTARGKIVAAATEYIHTDAFHLFVRTAGGPFVNRVVHLEDDNITTTLQL